MSKTLHGKILTFPTIARAIADLRGVSVSEARNEMCGLLVTHVEELEREEEARQERESQELELHWPAHTREVDNMVSRRVKNTGEDWDTASRHVAGFLRQRAAE
jgi:proteasome lid subunit RPN8/RPN11